MLVNENDIYAHDMRIVFHLFELIRLDRKYKVIK